MSYQIQPHRQRCAWVPSGNELYERYHDTEWGVPLHDDRALFENLILEVAQAGLSWLTVLKKRENYRAAFANFDPLEVSVFTEEDSAALLQNPGIIRNRLKIKAAITNAHKFLDIQHEFGSFSAYQWTFVNGIPLQPGRREGGDIPIITEEAKAFSTALRKRGFAFLGPTTMYAHMQATGMVNDHTIDCFRYAELSKLDNKQ
jgi:DNA-3-methyladenine glycosylase I